MKTHLDRSTHSTSSTLLEALADQAIRVANSPRPVEPVSERFPALEKQTVLFSFFAPDAKSVELAGNFNAWKPETAPLHHLGDGHWETRKTLRSGQYEYLFVVDGHWLEDPTAAQRTPNPSGGFNSVITVPLAVKTSLL